MEIGPDYELIRQLAYQWMLQKLPTNRLTYYDYIRALEVLHRSIGDPAKTKAIFEGVINQAEALGKSSEWVDKELRFEALLEFAEHRVDMLNLDLARQGTVDDDALDLYNLRLNRFKDNG